MPFNNYAVIPKSWPVQDSKFEGDCPEDVRKFMHLIPSVTATKPLRLPYVDCLQVSSDEYRLSWAWPSPSVGLTGAVVGVRELGGIWIDHGTTEDVNYTFKGTT